MMKVFELLRLETEKNEIQKGKNAFRVLQQIENILFQFYYCLHITVYRDTECIGIKIEYSFPTVAPLM